nr:hypothetical protein [uncultured Desulfobacter sp.]
MGNKRSCFGLLLETIKKFMVFLNPILKLNKFAFTVPVPKAITIPVLTLIWSSWTIL